MLIGLMQIAVTGNGNPTEDLTMHDEHDDEFEDEDELDEHDGEYQEFDVCPYCGTLLNELNGQVECPNCGERF